MDEHVERAVPGWVVHIQPDGLVLAHVPDAPLGMLASEAVEGLTSWNVLWIDYLGQMFGLDDSRIDGRKRFRAKGFDEFLWFPCRFVTSDIPVVGIGHVDRKSDGHRGSTGPHAGVSPDDDLFEVVAGDEAGSDGHHADGGISRLSSDSRSSLVQIRPTLELPFRVRGLLVEEKRCGEAGLAQIYASKEQVESIDGGYRIAEQFA